MYRGRDNNHMTLDFILSPHINKLETFGGGHCNGISCALCKEINSNTSTYDSKPIHIFFQKKHMYMLQDYQETLSVFQGVFLYLLQMFLPSAYSSAA